MLKNTVQLYFLQVKEIFTTFETITTNVDKEVSDTDFHELSLLHSSDETCVDSELAKLKYSMMISLKNMSSCLPREEFLIVEVLYRREQIL